MTARTVLLAEDEPDLAMLASELLEDEGYVVAHARNGRQALGLLTVLRPSVMVLDMMMPELDGFGVLRALRSDSARPPPVLAVSSFEEYLSLAQNLGASETLSKPFEPDAFLSAVDRLARGSPRKAPPRPVPLDERSRLRAVLELELDRPAPTAALDQFAQRVARIFGVPVCLVSIVTRDRQCWHAQCGLPADLAAACGTPREDSFCTHAVVAQAALVVQDALDNPYFVHNRLVRERGLRFYAGVPIVTRGGAVLGTLCLLDFAPRAFTAFDLELLGLLARRALAELEWREQRLRPGIPESAFQGLAWVDRELLVLARGAFAQALQLQSLRCAERSGALAVAVVEVPPERLAEVNEELKLAFPGAILGRLGQARLGVLAAGAGVDETAAQARESAGPGARVTCASAPRILSSPEAFLGELERRLDPPEAPDEQARAAGLV